MYCIFIVGVVVLSSWRGTKSFTVPPTELSIPKNERWQTILRPFHMDSDGCEYTNTTISPLLSASPASVTIHTSRRKFIQHATTAFTFGAYSSSPAAAEPTTNNKNVIVPLGPLAPFSSIRTYRNLELSNGLKVLLVQDRKALQSSASISIDGAGQFSEPEEIPGLAHLMEHIVLSSSRSRGGKKVLQRKARKLWKNGYSKQNNEGEYHSSEDEEDFEYWLSGNEGDSNAFTAPGFVCFHFNVPHENLPEGLERFAQLFTLDEVESTITEKPWIIPREIGRVNDELDSTSDQSRAFYFLKQQINPEHPFSRFTAGSRQTLQRLPMEKEIDIPMELLQFFRDHYVASRATLVVVSKDDVSALDRWISPFSNVMSQKVSKYSIDMQLPYPLMEESATSKSKALTQSIILRSKDDVIFDENIQTLCIEWPLSLSYFKGTSQAPPSQNIITSASVGFVLSQIISRRGPGSLRFFLEKFGWVPKGSTKGVPRITFPVDVSGFQILRMEIGLTLDGFQSRSAVVAAVFEGLRTAVSKPLQLDLFKQYLSTGLLHGYLFAPRPPDAVTLAVDALRFGIGGTSGVGNNNFNWYLMPSPEDSIGIERMREAVTETLRIMADEEKAIISFRASPKAIFEHSGGIVDQKVTIVPLFAPWSREPITGARYLVESRANGGSSYFKSMSWFAATFDGEELSPPYLNPLIPTNIRPPRPVIERQGNWGRRFFYLEDANALEDPPRTNPTRTVGRSGLKLTNEGIWSELKPTVPLEINSSWKLWQIPPGYKGVVGLQLPVRPPEPGIECAFVVQLASSLPAAFTTSQLALVNLWLISFDDEILGLAELGAAAGIAYETSLNRSGLRICFRGVSQTLPSYVRRFCRRLIQHHIKLLDGSTKMAASVPLRASALANRSPQMSRAEKDYVANFVTVASERDVANEASFFLKCTSGGYLITQGDILPRESLKLLSELQFIFRDYTKASNSFVTSPGLRDLLYRPIWKPSMSSPCLLPGVPLISDACGRVAR